MLAHPAQGQPDSLDGFLYGGVPRYFQAKTSGDGIDLGRIERDSAAINGSDQLPSAFVVRKRGGLAEKNGLQPREKALGPA
ncbi:MAG: hypothetical protein H6R13_3031 [Proteobacteria bacterium]|nr:hypothetical protein [Pseudomonadota bacterium]